MKKTVLAAAVAAVTLMLAACASTASPQPSGPYTPPAPDRECPRADGQPCL